MSTTTDAPEAAAAPAAPSVKELTYAEIAEYKDKKKMYTVIHDKVYDMTAFVDEHPEREEEGHVCAAANDPCFARFCLLDGVSMREKHGRTVPLLLLSSTYEAKPFAVFVGGEEVLLDVAGVDSTESFEDVGHSDEAREILKDLLIGNLKRLTS
ncbi:hypothetical protein KEM55_003160 [Ascosphaera atra]|nr:hypothetical protein KEM55_003160 [Ascosphaera atra]